MALRKFVPAWIVWGRDEFHALCTIFRQQLEVSKKGKYAVKNHNKSDKQKQVVKSTVKNSSILSFTKSTRWTSEEEKFAAAEGVWAYHIATHVIVAPKCMPI